MAKKSTASTKADHKHADLTKKINDLEKKVTALEKRLAGNTSGESDSRVDKIWAALSAFPKFKRFLK